MYMIKVLSNPYDNTLLFHSYNEAAKEADRLTKSGHSNTIHDSDNGYPYDQQDRNVYHMNQERLNARSDNEQFIDRVNSNYHI